MTPWTLLDTAPVPGGEGTLSLFQRRDEFMIKITGVGELMNSRMSGSEEALAELACRRLADREGARVLVGGLGMGFTLAAALQQLGTAAEAVVAELVPAVVEWNRGVLGELAGHPLADPRTRVHVGDVGGLLRKERNAFDAILLDVDNGPEGLTRRDNDRLYTLEGLSSAMDALRPGGVLAVWSAGPDERFTERLRRAGFAVETLRVKPHHGSKRARHTIWLGARAA